MQITSKTLSVLYTNYKGETSWRVVTPKMPEVALIEGGGMSFVPSFRFGTATHHPEPTWLIDVYDHGKKAQRTFALTNIRMMLPYYKFPILGPVEDAECLQGKPNIDLFSLETTKVPVELPKKPPIIISIYRKPDSANWSFTQEQVEAAEARLKRDVNQRETIFLLKEMDGTIVYRYHYTNDTSWMLELKKDDGSEAPWYLLKADELYAGGVGGLERVKGV